MRAANTDTGGDAALAEVQAYAGKDFTGLGLQLFPCSRVLWS
jgi:hypothetical protein